MKIITSPLNNQSVYRMTAYFAISKWWRIDKSKYNRKPDDSRLFHKKEKEN